MAAAPPGGARSYSVVVRGVAVGIARERECGLHSADEALDLLEHMYPHQGEQRLQRPQPLDPRHRVEPAVEAQNLRDLPASHHSGMHGVARGHLRVRVD
jgi:hypothetical protein